MLRDSIFRDFVCQSILKNFDKVDNTYESEQQHTLTHVFSRGSEQIFHNLEFSKGKNKVKKNTVMIYRAGFSISSCTLLQL